MEDTLRKQLSELSVSHGAQLEEGNYIEYRKHIIQRVEGGYTIGHSDKLADGHPAQKVGTISELMEFMES